MERLRESIGDSLGNNAKLTAKAVFEETLADLRAADDWRASKAAFDVVMEWNEWLGDIGEQEREPIDIRSSWAADLDPEDASEAEGDRERDAPEESAESELARALRDAEDE